MSPIERGRVARKLPEDARRALKSWPAHKPWIGSMLTGPAGYAIRPDGGAPVFLSERSARVLIRAGLAEERLLWLALTDAGAEVREWLAGKTTP